MIWVVHPGSGSWLFTLPGSRIQGSKRHRIPDPQHWLNIWPLSLLIFRFGQRCEASCPAPPDPRRPPAGVEAAGAAVQQPSAEDCKIKIRNSRIFLYTSLSPEKNLLIVCFVRLHQGHHIKFQAKRQAQAKPSAGDCKKFPHFLVYLYKPRKKISQLCVLPGCNQGHHINKCALFFFLFQNFQYKSLMAIYIYIFQRAWPVCSSAWRRTQLASTGILSRNSRTRFCCTI